MKKTIVCLALATPSLLVIPSASANLLVNGDFESGDTGFTSGFTHTTDGDIHNAGEYAITTNPNLVHSTAASYGDHTTGSGLMMAINGEGGDEMAWSQTVAVDPGTSYTFSVWTSTWFLGGGLQLNINGIDVGDPFVTPSTGWVETTRQWSSGAATSASISLINSGNIPSANDFALDDISFAIVPEPASLGLLALSGLLLRRRPRNN